MNRGRIADAVIIVTWLIICGLYIVLVGPHFYRSPIL